MTDVITNPEKQPVGAEKPVVSSDEKPCLEPLIALKTCRQAHEVEIYKLKQAHSKDISHVCKLSIAGMALLVLIIVVMACLAYNRLQKTKGVR